MLAKQYQDKDSVTKYSYIVKLVANDRSDKFRAEAMGATAKGHL